MVLETYDFYQKKNTVTSPIVFIYDIFIGFKNFVRWVKRNGTRTSLAKD